MYDQEAIIAKMIEVTLKNPDDFLKVRETLTRMGIAGTRTNKLYQSCHILHKRGRYFIVHFKELFSLDGKEATFGEDDEARRNTIASLLEQWELVHILDESRERVEKNKASMAEIKILSFSEKKDWELIPKYSIGRKKDSGDD
jgi:hypothetical protein